jgi:iron complex transport system substrate-binding protein
LTLVRLTYLVDAVEGEFAAARDAHPQFAGKSGVVAYADEGNVGGYAPSDTRGQLMTALGFEIPQAVVDRAGDLFYADSSKEEMTVLDTDVLVWIASTDDEVAQIRSDPLRQQLSAAKEGREVFFDQIPGGAAGFSSVLSLPFLLRWIVPQLAATVDGDPATTAAP